MAQNFSQYELQPIQEQTLEDLLNVDGGTVSLTQGELQSPNFVTAQQGWKVNSEGNAEFQSIKVGNTTQYINFNGTTLEVVGGLVISENSLSAGHAISAYDVVMVGDGTSIAEFEVSTASGLGGGQSFGKVNPGADKVSQSFAGADCATEISRVSLYLKKTGSPTDTLYIKVYSGSQEGTLLASSSIAGTALTASFVKTDIDLDTRITPAGGTTYFITLSRSGSRDDVNYFDIQLNGAAYGNGIGYTHNDAGWADSGNDYYFELSVVYTSGSVFQASAAQTQEVANLTFGIAQAAAATGATISIQTGGTMTNTGWSWTAGDIIYVSDTAGSLQNSPGTFMRSVGRAISATQITLDGLLSANLAGRANTLFTRFTFLGSQNDGLSTAGGVTRNLVLTTLSVGGGTSEIYGSVVTATDSSIINWSSSFEVTIAIKLSGTFSTTNTFIGFLYTNGGDQTPTTAKHIGFQINNATVKATNGDGSTGKTTTVSATVTNFNTYRFVKNGTGVIYFYINDSLVATHTQYLPISTANPPYFVVTTRDVTNAVNLYCANGYSVIVTP